MAKILSYITDEMPIERLFDNGAQSLSDTELLSIILGTGSSDMNVIELSRSLLQIYGGLAKMSQLDTITLMQNKGIGKSKAARLCSIFELARRLDDLKPSLKHLANSPEAIYEYAKYKLRFKERERFLVLHLNTKHEIFSHEIISIGTGNKTFAEPKEVFKKALQVSAYSICVCHNHPSSHLEPSKADLELTKRLVESGNILGIPLVDHLIIGENDYYSFKANGNM